MEPNKATQNVSGNTNTSPSVDPTFPGVVDKRTYYPDPLAYVQLCKSRGLLPSPASYVQIYSGSKPTDAANSVPPFRDLTMLRTREVGTVLHNMLESFATGKPAKKVDPSFLNAFPTQPQFIARFPLLNVGIVVAAYEAMQNQEYDLREHGAVFPKTMQEMVSANLRQERSRFTAYFATLLGAVVPDVPEPQMDTHEGGLNILTSVLSNPVVGEVIKDAVGAAGFFDAPLKTERRNVMSCNVDRPVDGYSHNTCASDLDLTANAFQDKIDPLDFIKRAKDTWGLVGNISWKSTDNAESFLKWGLGFDQLTGIPITPVVCPVGYTNGNETIVDVTPLSFLSEYYAYWTGGLEFRFEAVCTPYHQGQLVIIYVPGNYWTLTGKAPAEAGDPLVYPPSFADISHCMMYSFTLNDNSVTEKKNMLDMRIPYINDTIYQTTGFRAQEKINGHYRAMAFSSVGTLYVMVQNPLAATSVVAPEIELNVYVRASGDFNFHVINPIGGKGLNDGQETIEMYTANVHGQYQGDAPSSSTNVQTGGDDPGQKFDDATTTQPEHPQVTEFQDTAPPEAAATNNLTQTNWSTVACMPTAATDNIFARQYRIGTFTWTSSQVRATFISQYDMPRAFFDAVPLAFDVKKYHLYGHHDWEITLKFNATQFHCGVLKIIYIPGTRTPYDFTFTSWDCFPHVELNIANTTTASLVIPYSWVSQFMPTNKAIGGRFYVVVWNPLRTAATQAQGLTATVWMRAVNPFFGVKTSKKWVADWQGPTPTIKVPNQGLTPGGTSDGRVGQGQFTTAPKAMKPFIAPGCKVCGPINKPHSNGRQLLHRAELIYLGKPNLTVPAADTARLMATYDLPYISGARHLALLWQMTFISGSTRHHVITTASKSSPLMAWSQYVPQNKGPGDHGVAEGLQKSWAWTYGTMRGTTMTRLCDDPEFVIEVPGYRETPYEAVSDLTHTGHVMLGFYGDDPQGVRVAIAWSIGENFQGHLCAGCPVVRHTGPPTSFWDSEKITPVPQHSVAEVAAEIKTLKLERRRSMSPYRVLPDIGQAQGPGCSKAMRVVATEQAEAVVNTVKRVAQGEPIITAALEEQVMAIRDMVVDLRENLRIPHSYVDVKPRPPVLQANFSDPCTDEVGTGQGWSWTSPLASIKETFDLLTTTLRSLTTTSNLINKQVEWCGRKFKNILEAVEHFLDQLWTVVEWSCQVIVLAYLAVTAPGPVLACGVVNFCAWLAKRLPGIQLPTVPPEQEPGAEPQMSRDEFEEHLFPYIIKGFCKFMGCDSSDVFAYIGFKQHSEPDRNKFLSALIAVVRYLISGKTAMADDAAIVVTQVQAALVAADKLKKIKHYREYLEKKTEVDKTVQDLKKLTHIMYMSPKIISPALAQRAEAALKILQELDESNKHFHGKPEPIGIYIVGTPGCGKTTLVSYLSLAIAKATGCNERAFYWPTDDEQKYADGYMNEDIVVFDDAMVTTSSTHLTTAIRLLNVENIPVNMADIKDKGKKFTSRYVIFTSNVRTTNANNVEVNCPEAFVRRMTFPITLRPRDAYSTAEGRLDKDKFNAGFQRIVDDFTIESLAKFLDEVYHVGKFTFNAPIDQEYSWARFFHDFIAEARRRNTVNDMDKEYKIRILTQLGAPQMHNGEERVRLTAKHVKPADLDLFTMAPIGTVLEDDLLPYVEDVDPAKVYEYSADFNMAIYRHAMRDRESARYVSSRFMLESMRNLMSEEDKQSLLTEPKTVKKPYRGICAGIVAVLAAAGMAALAAKIAIQLVAMTKNVVDQLTGTFEGDYARMRPRAAKPVKPVRTYEGFTQGPDAFDYIRRNTRRITSMYIDEAGLQHPSDIHALAICDRYLLVNKHFMEFRAEKKASTIYMENPMKQGDMRPLAIIRAIDVADEKGRPYDVVLLEVEGMTHVRDIRSSFVTHKMVEGYVASGRDQPVVLLSDRHEQCEEVQASVGSWNNAYVREWTDRAPLLVNVIRSGATRRGDCGRPYVGGPALQNKIIGIHSAGAAQSTGMTVITQELIASLMSPTDIALDVDAEVQFEPHGNNPYWTTDMENYGPQEFNGVKLQRHPVMKTKFEPFVHSGLSLPHPDWECDMKPAAQHPTMVGDVKLHPLYTNVQKYDTRAKAFLAEPVYQEMLDYFNRTRMNKLVTIGEPLSEEEMINGFDRAGISMDKIVINTSCGYWTLLGFADGKKEFFNVSLTETGNWYTWSDKALYQKLPMWECSFVERLRRVEAMCREGKVPFVPWVTGTKDELRPAEKVLLCKTRTFEMPGIEHTLLMRKYFGHFIAAYKAEAGVFMHHGIGKDKPTVWAEYFDHLTQVSSRGFDVDYKNYDGSVTIGAYRWFRDVTDYYYRDGSIEDKRARHVLIKIMQEAYLIVGQDLCRTVQGNKSGTAVTDVFNSITNTYVLYAAYMLACHKHEMPMDLTAFDSHIRFITYGDDVICTRSEKYSFFNRIIVAEMADYFGMKVTSARKDDVLVADDPIEDLTFLCSAFVVDNDVVLCPMKLQSIYKELCWRPRDLRDDETDLKQRIQNTTMFMAEHGEGAFKTFKKQLLECGVNPGYIHAGSTASIPSVPMRTYDMFRENKAQVQTHAAWPEVGRPQMDNGIDEEQEERDRLEAEAEYHMADDNRSQTAQITAHILNTDIDVTVDDTILTIPLEITHGFGRHRRIWTIRPGYRRLNDVTWNARRVSGIRDDYEFIYSFQDDEGRLRQHRSTIERMWFSDGGQVANVIAYMAGNTYVFYMRNCVVYNRTVYYDHTAAFTPDDDPDSSIVGVYDYGMPAHWVVAAMEQHAPDFYPTNARGVARVIDDVVREVNDNQDDAAEVWAIISTSWNENRHPAVRHVFLTILETLYPEAGEMAPHYRELIGRIHNHQRPVAIVEPLVTERRTATVVDYDGNVREVEVRAPTVQPNPFVDVEVELERDIQSERLWWERIRQRPSWEEHPFKCSFSDCKADPTVNPYFKDPETWTPPCEDVRHTVTTPGPYTFVEYFSFFTWWMVWLWLIMCPSSLAMPLATIGTNIRQWWNREQMDWNYVITYHLGLFVGLLVGWYIRPWTGTTALTTTWTGTTALAIYH